MRNPENKYVIIKHPIVTRYPENSTKTLTVRVASWPGVSYSIVTKCIYIYRWPKPNRKHPDEEPELSKSQTLPMQILNPKPNLPNTQTLNPEP